MAISRPEKVIIKLKISTGKKARLGENSDISMIYNKMKIGSSFTPGGSSPLSGFTFDEEKKFLPRILGLSAEHQDFRRAVTNYWADISREVDPVNGLPLEIGMIYGSEADAKKGDAEAMKEAEKLKQARIGHYRYDESFEIRTSLGEPINLADYIIYRYCLKYSRVANNPDDLYKSPKIDFYIHSETAEKSVKKAALDARRKSYAEYLELITNIDKTRDVAILLKKKVDAHNGLPTTDTILKIDNDIDTEITLEVIAKTYPADFMRIVSDKKITMKAFIERCISANELRRLPNTETIVFGDNTVVGGNMDEAVAYLSQDKNKEVLNTLKARAKAFKK